MCLCALDNDAVDLGVRRMQRAAQLCAASHTLRHSRGITMVSPGQGCSA